MTQTVTPTVIFLALATPLLVFAAARDVATRLIPDAVPIVIVVFGVSTRLAEGWVEAGWSLAIGLGLFLALVPIAARGWLGGGDVKLLGAIATGLPPMLVWDFVVATVFLGGALGIAYILGRHVVPECRATGDAGLLRRVLVVEAWRIRRRGPLPYAVAIAGGAILLLTSMPRA